MISRSESSYGPDAVEEPVTIGQRLLLAMDRVRGESGALNCPVLCSLEGDLRPGAVQAAVCSLMREHTALRTRFRLGRMPQQVVHSSLDVPFDVVDVSGGDAAYRAERYVERQLSRRIDPTASPLDVHLYRLSPESHLLLINVTHFVTDLISSSVLLEDLADALRGFENPARAASRSFDSLEFSRWQRRQLASGAFGGQNRYWHERLANLRMIETPLGRSRADRYGSTGIMETAIDAATSRRLEEIADRERTPLPVVLLATLFYERCRETGQRDLAVASLFSSRSTPKLRRTVAFLVNTLLIRVRLRPDPCFLDVLKQTKRAISGAMRNADLPFQAVSPPPPRGSAQPGVRPDDVVFNSVSSKIEASYSLPSLDIRSRIPRVVGRFDLEMAVRPDDDRFVVRLTFNEHRLTAKAAGALLDAYTDTARQVAIAPRVRLEGP